MHEPEEQREPGAWRYVLFIVLVLLLAVITVMTLKDHWARIPPDITNL